MRRIIFTQRENNIGVSIDVPTNSIKIYGPLEDQTTLNPVQHFYHLLTYIHIFIVYFYTKYKLFACPFNISQFRKRHMYSAASTYSV